jgi:peptidoglycan/xylan/chitin deacetylase (PgdA/CDA1 family)
VIAFFVRREGAVFNVVAIVFDGGADERGGISVLADKLGRRGEGEVDEVVEDEDLAVAVRAGADADGGNGQLGGDGGGDFAGNAFEYDCAGSGIGQGESVCLELEHGFSGAGLDAVAAHAVNALRSEAQMADNGNFSFSEGADQIDARTLDFDRLGAGLLDEADGVDEAFGHRAVIAAEGHVGHKEGAANGAADGASVVQHLVHGDGEGVFVAQDHHGQRVAYQDEVDAGFVGEARGGVVVGGESGDGLALALHLSKRGHGDFCGWIAVGRGFCFVGEVSEAHVVSSAAPLTQDATRTRRVYAGLRVGDLETSHFRAGSSAKGLGDGICRTCPSRSTLEGRMLSPLAAGIYGGLGAAAGLGLAAGGCAYAAYWPGSRIFGKALIAPRRPGELALTFDDGPNPAFTPRLLDALASHDVRATFFMVGSHAQAEPELVRRIVAEGHLIGNHSWSHANLALASAGRVREELARTSQTLEQIAGVPVRLFRPPFGARRPAVLRIARELRLEPVLWNAMTSDWKEPSADVIVERLTRTIDRLERRGWAANIVLHDGNHLDRSAERGPSDAAAGQLVSRYKATHRFVTLDAWW